MSGNMRVPSGGQIIGDPRGGGFWLEFYTVAEIDGNRPKEGGQKIPMWRIRERNSGGHVIAYGEIHPDMPKNLQETGRRWGAFLAGFVANTSDT